MWTLGLALVLIAGAVHAQQDVEPLRLAFQVDEFTSEQRDALARELQASGEFRIAFACVPAGILVVERSGASLRDEDHGTVAEAVHRHMPHGRPQPGKPSLIELEARCAVARNF